MSANKNLLIGAIIFPGFDCLDLYGPLRFFGTRTEDFTIKIVAETHNPVPSTARAATHVDHTFDDCPHLDVVLLPGGIGTRAGVKNERLLGFIRAKAEAATYVLTVCTGSGLLAATGVLDGRKATSNKMAWDWVIGNGECMGDAGVKWDRVEHMRELPCKNIDWIKKARWVDDGKYISAGGVSAGMDMGLHFIERICGKEAALWTARTSEYDWHQDPNWDPFTDMIEAENEKLENSKQ
ncbi:ThiJ/PfpI domain-containing protein [Jimgerdemannia flammicorona]|uniref:ThiJ/PfpI domain-containing protein n=1 Tax=Jimgerdemannia flammicorona TaxID=994334 RepID=A0A433B9B4_9FUNG|nr:ThiJ/PfpI domain-containing protein [Jimgerdemannia flammicorona]